MRDLENDFYEVLGTEVVDDRTTVRHHLKVTTPFDEDGRLLDVDVPRGLSEDEVDDRLYHSARELLANRGGPAIPATEETEE